LNTFERELRRRLGLAEFRARQCWEQAIPALASGESMPGVLDHGGPAFALTWRLWEIAITEAVAVSEGR
jgi:hypothetical protein